MCVSSSSPGLTWLSSENSEILGLETCMLSIVSLAEADLLKLCRVVPHSLVLESQEAFVEDLAQL